jgi:hypothetical protein
MTTKRILALSVIQVPKLDRFVIGSGGKLSGLGRGATPDRTSVSIEADKALEGFVLLVVLV